MIARFCVRDSESASERRRKKFEESDTPISRLRTLIWSLSEREQMFIGKGADSSKVLEHHVEDRHDRVVGDYGVAIL